MTKPKKKGRKLVTTYCVAKRWPAVNVGGAGAAVLVSLQQVYADAIWNRFSTIMKDVYGQLVAISTIVAVTVAAIALLVRMISRNQRAVDEATSWLKRIVVTWITLNSLGFICGKTQDAVKLRLRCCSP